MSDLQRKYVIQILLLVGLLGGLAFTTWKMFMNFNPAPPKSSKAPAARVARPAAAPSADTTGKAEERAPAQPAGEASQAAPSQGQPDVDLYRVYALQPPRNPFVQQEEWYKESLDKYPGYPWLRDSGYFDSMSPDLPDISRLFGADKSWESVSLSRETSDLAKIEGMSKDGRIKTNIELKGETPPPVSLTWTKESGVPLSALSHPGWEKQYAARLQGPAGEAAGMPSPAAAAAGGGETLGIPGIAGETASAVATGGEGDKLACVGVNLKDDRSSALMVFNGSPYLVTAGSVLPTHYQVLEIKKDGVVVIELRDGSSLWVPLSAPPPPEKGARRKQTAPQPADAGGHDQGGT